MALWKSDNGAGGAGKEMADSINLALVSFPVK